MKAIATITSSEGGTAAVVFQTTFGHSVKAMGLEVWRRSTVKRMMPTSTMKYANR